MSLAQFRRDLAMLICPDLAKEAEIGWYLRLHVQESRDWLCEFRPIKRTLDRIVLIVDNYYAPIGTKVAGEYEPVLGRFRDDLRTEQELVVQSPDPVLERLYADAIVRGETQRERINELLTRNTELLSEVRVLKKLPPEEPFEGFRDCRFPDGQSFRDVYLEKKAAQYSGA